MIRLGPLVALLVLPAAAAAQPVSFQLKNDVPAGQKPTLTLMAMERVLEVKLDLARDDGEKFTQTLAALDAGKQAVLPVGDGKAGKAHCKGTIAVAVPGTGPWSYDLEFDTLVRAPMTINYDYDHLDPAGHAIKFQQSRPAGSP